jgi:NhaP-type Na+/H+ or K+/H+ antiporter
MTASSRLSISSAAIEFLWIFGGGLLVGLAIAVAAKFLLGLLNDPFISIVLQGYLLSQSEEKIRKWNLGNYGIS